MDIDAETFAPDTACDFSPGTGVVEAVVGYNHQVWICGFLLDAAVGVARELLRCAEIVAASQRLVDNFDADDGVGELEGAVFGSHGFEDLERFFVVGGMLPVYDAVAIAGGLLPVLGARRAMAVENYFHVGGACPGDGFVEVVGCAVLVGGGGLIKGPVSDWDSESRYWLAIGQ